MEQSVSASSRRYARGTNTTATLKGALQQLLLENDTLSSGPFLHYTQPLGGAAETTSHPNEAQNLSSVFAETRNDTDHYNYTSGDLWRENEAVARTVIPSMVYVAVLMAVGVPGNGLAIYVYGVKFRVATQHFLIVCLALCDLVIGLVAMPTEIADLRFHLTFSSKFACRLLRFLTLFCALTSNCILVVIAVDRYRRVCHPLRRQMTVRDARLGAGLSVLLSLVLAWPLFVITGLRTTATSRAGLMGKDCSFSDEFNDTAYPLALMATLGGGFVVMAVVLAALYSRIWRQARAHRQGWSATACGSFHPKVKVKVASGSAASSSSSPPPGSPVTTSSPTTSHMDKAAPFPTDGAAATSAVDLRPLSGGESEKGGLYPLNVAAAAVAAVRSLSESEKSGPFSLKTAAAEVSSLSESGNAGCSPVTTTIPTTTLSETENSPSSTASDDAVSSTASAITTTQPLSGVVPMTGSESNLSIITLRSKSIVGYPTESPGDSNNSIRTARKWPKLFKKGKGFTMDKTTLVVFAVTLVFVLSFLPYLSLMLVRGVVHDFDHSLSGSVQLNFYNIFVRSYLLNSAANPVIYGVFNAKFRLEVVTLFRKMTSLLCCCRQQIA